MLRTIFFFFFLLFITTAISAQDTTLTAQPDTLDSTVTAIETPPYPADTVSRRPISIFRNETLDLSDSLSIREVLFKEHPFFSFNTLAVSSRSDIKRFEGKELLFYVVVSLILIFAVLRLSFWKYFNDLFRVFFRTTLKQRQIKEQLMQTPFPSLVFNGFFAATGGLYINLVLHYFQIAPINNFWLQYLYCAVGLAVIYFGKFIGLTIFGWLFSMRKAADSYVFIVFIINKVIGITLLPFIVLLSFTDGVMYSVTLVLSWCAVGGLFLYRFILGFAAIRNEVRFNLFHFFLYLCAFEIAPLLLIYKLLLFFF